MVAESPQPPAAAPDSFNPLMGIPRRPFHVILYVRQLLQLKPVTKLTRGPFAEIPQVAPHGVSNLCESLVVHFATLVKFFEQLRLINSIFAQKTLILS